jgi:UDP:flavonoid glycosyltransferase YjiC (YdhE family)
MKKPRILLIPSPSSAGSVGSVTKSIGIARSLEKRGCEICFIMGGKLGALISRYGYQVITAPVPLPKRTIQEINNVEDVIQWTGMADPDYVEASVNTQMGAINTFKPDVIFAETDPCAAISVGAAKIPSLMICSWPGHPDFPCNRQSSKKTLPIFNKQFKRFKLPESENAAELLYMRADVKVAPTLPELEPELQNREGIEFTGYILDTGGQEAQLPPRRQDRDNKQIFIYLSVGAIPPDIYIQVIKDTFKDLPYHVLCVCGYHYSLESLPGSTGTIRFERFIPAQAVMRGMSMVIFHGGQDTMLTTLLYGLPSLTIPGQHFEREYNAEQLARLGTSKKLPIYAFRPSRLRHLVEEILDEDNLYIKESQKLQNRLKQYRGTEQCADILLTLNG